MPVCLLPRNANWRTMIREVCYPLPICKNVIWSIAYTESTLFDDAKAASLKFNIYGRQYMVEATRYGRQYMAGWMAIYGWMNQSKAIYGGWWSNNKHDLIKVVSSAGPTGPYKHDLFQSCALYRPTLWPDYDQSSELHRTNRNNKTMSWFLLGYIPNLGPLFFMRGRTLV